MGHWMGTNMKDILDCHKPEAINSIQVLSGACI